MTTMIFKNASFEIENALTLDQERTLKIVWNTQRLILQTNRTASEKI